MLYAQTPERQSSKPAPSSERASTSSTRECTVQSATSSTEPARAPADRLREFRRVVGLLCATAVAGIGGPDEEPTIPLIPHSA